jgi:hypothetical protein
MTTRPYAQSGDLVCSKKLYDTWSREIDMCNESKYSLFLHD